MITIEKKLDLTTEYDLRVLGDPEKILFFDIETTGLSAHNSSVYLIGCLAYEDDAFCLRHLRDALRAPWANASPQTAATAPA